MDRPTVDAYEGDDAAARFREQRRAYRPERAARFASTATGVRLDVGAGVGHYTKLLGEPVVSLDASHAMLRLVPAPSPCVQGDIAALPFRRAVFGGAWAARTYQHLPHEALPLALADLHRTMELGAPLSIHVFAGEGAQRRGDDDAFPGRLFAFWDQAQLRAVIQGAGFAIDRVDDDGDNLEVEATRALTLPDFVRPNLTVLFCGYNPSIYAAERGVPFARPGNRFWPAVIEAGVVSVDRDPWHAVHHHDVGFTDLVKRATVAAAELSIDELRAGLDRVRHLCEWLRPEVVCVLGIGGWRRLVDRRAAVGWHDARLGPSRVYVMPNPSGLNASTQHAGFVEHLRALLVA